MAAIKKWLLLVVLLIPTAGAIHPGTWETTLPLRYVTDDHTVNLDNPGNGDIHQFNASVGKRTDFTVENATVGFRVAVTSLYAASSDGSYNITFSWNGTTLEECYFHLITRDPGGFLTGDFPVYTYHQMFCLIRTDVLGNDINSSTVNREVVVNKTILSGTPDPIEDMHMNFEFLRTDEYIVSVDQNELLGFTSTLGAFLVVMILLGVSLIRMPAVVEMLVYLLGVAAAITATVDMPSEYNALRFLTVGVGLYFVLKLATLGYTFWQEYNGGE